MNSGSPANALCVGGMTQDLICIIFPSHIIAVGAEVIMEVMRMYITTKTIITFELDENEAIQSFLRSNNINEWRVESSTTGISYIRTENLVVNPKRGEEK